MANTKTPVMVLQELSVKRGWVTPEYNITHSKQGTHENEFHYEVKVESVVGYGVGRSKQIAKHEAARSALESLMKLNLYSPDETVIKAPRSEAVGSPIKLVVNAIGNLTDICAENKIPFPTFTEISDVGPPHCKEFTYDCQIALITTRATAGTKKQAKQLAAKEMLDRLIQALPDLIDEYTDHELTELAITEQDQKVSECYVQLKKLTKPKRNLSLKIRDYATNFKNINNERDVNLEDLQACLKQEPTEELLKTFLDKLELDYVIEPLTDTSCLVLTINTDVPFTVIALEDSYSSCFDAVLKKTFRTLSTLLE
ncbi:hypothetical protein FQR65_LT10603 [Abscondita terminalis]|nr:hypothetical protein FQR65_LT10603 [Abscondita terminalis]